MWKEGTWRGEGAEAVGRKRPQAIMDGWSASAALCSLPSCLSKCVRQVQGGGFSLRPCRRRVGGPGGGRRHEGKKEVRQARRLGEILLQPVRTAQWSGVPVHGARALIGGVSVKNMEFAGCLTGANQWPRQRCRILPLGLSVRIAASGSVPASPEAQLLTADPWRGRPKAGPSWHIEADFMRKTGRTFPADP